MAADTKELPVETLYLELNKSIKSGDHEKTLKACNKLLHHYPQEKSAFHCKIVALILTEKYEDVLKQLKAYPQFAKDLLFEKAYSEYRLKRNADALATIEEGSKTDLRLMELQAQVYFREENFDSAYSKYRVILKECKDDSEEERRANLSAVVACMRMFQDNDVGPLKVPEDTYELKYNSACYQIGRGDFKQAAASLEEAEKMLHETLEGDPDTTQQEINDELAPIRVQLGYVYHRLGDISKANDIYLNVIKQRPEDAASLAVAANNLVCINRDQNIFDSRKRIKVATAEGAQAKLTRVQRHRIAVNEALFYHYTNQAELCRKSALRLLEDSEAAAFSGDVRPELIYVAQLVKERQVGAAVAYLEERLDKKEDAASEAQIVSWSLTLAQLHLLQGAVSRACEVLSSARLPETIRCSPGVTSALVTLYRNLENADAAHTSLQECLKFARQNQQGGKYLHLLTTAAKVFMRNGAAQEAAKLYEEGLKLKPNDTGLLARLIHALSHFDKVQAEKMSKNLQAGDTLTEVEVDNLESAFLFGTKYTKRTGRTGDGTAGSPRIGSSPSPQTGNNAVAQAAPEKKKHKKKRKKVLPKNYDPNAIPDPERWLPRRERSYYRARRKDKRNPLRGPQGQTTGGADLDASSQPAPQTQPSPRPATSGTSSQASAPPAASGSSGTPPAAGKPKPKPGGGGRNKRR